MKAEVKASQFDKRFDDGADVLAHLDLSRARRVRQEQKRVNVDFPTWMIEMLDKEARRIGVTRQSIIKLWLAERLEKARSGQSVRQSVQGDAPARGR